MVEAIQTGLGAATLATADMPQQVECTNCSDDTAMIGIAVAAVALFISALSLYLGALRRPRVQIHNVPHSGALRFSSWRSGVASDAKLTLKLVVANTGAGGTYVERLVLSPVYASVGLPTLGAFKPDGRVYAADGAGSDRGPHAIAVERGDVRLVELHGSFDVLDGMDSPEFARRLHDLEAVDLDVEWTYHRRDLLRPGRRHAVQKAQTIRVETDRLRRDARRHWQRRSPLDEPEEIRILDGGR